MRARRLDKSPLVGLGNLRKRDEEDGTQRGLRRAVWRFGLEGSSFVELLAWRGG
jgi:hypothetical protein